MISQRLRVDTVLPGKMMQSYIGDWKSLHSYYLFTSNNPTCFSVYNPLPVPDPNFFRNAKFMVRRFRSVFARLLFFKGLQTWNKT